ncbi:S9 family peptidase [Dyadobacter sp. CY326]|uniref:alpha/beta hydrolase family protein n=1 Tax=Dyadobacter sp. CY326 TaxID=2907300 RepID=UPI001F31248F|nr:CocE/NonD family hydrolase [Dyadobacter sp. CY326]MCE7065137.1 alpha/beta hydrolase [Dyadobacter sp. CY326]
MRNIYYIIAATAFELLVACFLCNCQTRESVREAHHGQEPKPPYPYNSEDIEFTNSSAGVRLAGTLTRPSQKGIYPAVILITGSGPQDRNEEVNQGHKPFLVIADYLTKKGIAVLRYDDRGTYRSSGNFQQATSLDFCDDVESAVSYLKTRTDIDANKIGLIGHSEGATIASIVASRASNTAFIVLLAGPGLRGDTLLLIQGAAIRKSAGMSQEDIQKTIKQGSGLYNIVLKSQNPNTLKAELTHYANGLDIAKNEIPPNVTREQFIAQQVDIIASPWWQFFLKHDPSATHQKVTCPVLALNGSKDMQVTSKENLTAIASSLKKAGNKNLTIKELPDLNHFFQECETGSPVEYTTIDQTFSPTALKEMSDWIAKQID